MANNADYINDIEQLLPTVFIEQVILEPANTLQNQKLSSLRATMSLKDIVDKDGISQWFEEQDLQKFMKLRVFIIKSETLYNTILNFSSAEDYSYANILKIAEENKNLILKESYSLPTKEELEQNKGAFYTENYKVDNDDGTKEITVPIKAELRFLFDDEKDPFISIIAFMTFNLKEFASSFGITDILEENALSKSLTPMVVIRDKSVVSQFQYFLLPDGQFYYGQYHVNTEADGSIQYRTGAVETVESQDLQLVTDVQNIVCDMRSRRFFEDKSLIDEAGIINNFVKTDLQIKNLVNKNNKNVYSKYFSEPLFSLDEEGNCRFSFFFNKKKFILDNSFYPKVLDPIYNPNILAEQVRVKNISVYRIRKDIKEINFDSENSPILVASNSTSQQTKDILSTPDLSIYDGSYIVENNIEGINPVNIKSYSVYDSKMSDIGYGLYKYKISMEVEDPTRKVLENILNSLTKEDGVIFKLQKYYNAAISNKKDIVNGTYNSPEISGDMSYSKAKYTPYFDNLLGKFIPSFITENSNVALEAQFALLYFLTAAKAFNYYNTKTPAEELELISNMNKLLFPPTSSPDTISLVIKIVSDFVEKLQLLLGLTNEQKKASPSGKNNLLSFEYVLEPSSADNLGRQIEYKIDSMYDNYFNAAVMNGVGYKIIRNFTANADGFNSIELDQYKNITDFVSQKHFNDYTSLNIKEIYGEDTLDVYDFVDEFNDDNSKYSYLPVFSIGSIGNNYDLSSLSQQFKNQQLYQNMFLDVVNYNTIQQTNFTSQEVPTNSSLSKDDLIIKAQLLDLFGYYEFSDVSIATEEPVSSYNKNKNDGVYNVFGYSDPAAAVSKIEEKISNINYSAKSSTSNKNENPSSLLFELLLNELARSKDELDNLKNFKIFCLLDEKGDKNPDFFLDKVAGEAAVSALLGTGIDFNATVQDYIRSLPIPIKHLIVSRGNLLGVTKAYDDFNSVKDSSKYPENFFKFWINFKNLFEIQYFDSFDKDDVKSPIWKTLTIDKLNSSSSKILCRIQKYKLKSFEQYFPNIKKLEMPIFDKYFYIIPDNSIDLLVSVEKQIQTAAEISLPPSNNPLPTPNKVGPNSFVDDLQAAAVKVQPASKLEFVAASLVPTSIKDAIEVFSNQGFSTNINNISETRIAEQQRVIDIRSQKEQRLDVKAKDITNNINKFRNL